MDNIEKILDRGEKIELMVDKTEQLQFQAQDFQNQGAKIRRKMWFRNTKVKLICLSFLLFVVLMIWISLCRGFKCHV